MMFFCLGTSDIANNIDGVYKTGARGEKEDWEGTIRFGDVLPKWNYACTPVF